MTAREAYNKAYNAQKRMPEAEEIIMQDAYCAFFYAREVIKGRWLEAEPIIAQNAKYAYFYAKHLIKSRWLEAETFIMQDAVWAYFYAKDIIKGRWLKAEPIIIHSGEYACSYAREIIKGRWPEAEKRISMSEYKQSYVEAFFDEPVITKDQVGPFIWECMNLHGYFAPTSLFENKVSLLDMVIE